MRSEAWALLCGSLFALGLWISGAARPDVVLGALDLFGTPDASLYLFSATAILVRFAVVTVFGDSARGAHERRPVDGQLVVGSLIFGAGWGLAGICPGPAVASLLYGGWPFLLFFAALLFGLALGTRTLPNSPQLRNTPRE